MTPDEIVRRIAEMNPYDEEWGRCFFCHSEDEFDSEVWEWMQTHAPGCVWVAARKWVEEREK